MVLLHARVTLELQRRLNVVHIKMYFSYLHSRFDVIKSETPGCSFSLILKTTHLLVSVLPGKSVAFFKKVKYATLWCLLSYVL